MAVDWLVKAGLDLTQIDNDIKQLQAKMQAAGIQLNKQGRLPGATGGTAAVSKSQKSQEAHEARILAIHSKYTASLAAEEDRLKRIALSRQRELEIAREIVKYRKSEGDSTSEALKEARHHIDLAKKLGREYAQQKAIVEDIARTKRQDAKDSAEAARKQLADQRRIQQEEQRYIAQGQRLDSRIVGATVRQRSATLGTTDRKAIAAANLASAKADVSTLTQALLTQQWNPKDAASLNKRLEEAEQRLVGARAQVEKLNRGFLGTGDNLGKIIKKVTLWAIATGTVYTAVRGIENAMRSIAEVDFAKAGIAKVYRTKDANDIQSQRAAAEQLTTAAGPLAAAYGQPMLDVMKQMEGFARLGYKVNDIVKLTNASLLLQRAAGVDAADAIRLLTSTMNQYGLQVEDLNVQVNALNALENTTAARAKEIGEGVARAGAMAKSASVDLAELNSIIAILIETTGRPGSEIGRGVRTVFANIYSDEGVKDLQELGITVRGVNGDLKDGFTVIQELAARWSGLTDAQKQNIAATIAGKRQLDVFFGMMNQFPKIIDGITNQYKGLNSAMQEAALMQDTVQGQVQRLQATWTALVAGKGSGGLAETMKDAVAGVVKVVDALNSVDPETLKLMLALLTGGGIGLYGGLKTKNPYVGLAAGITSFIGVFAMLKNKADDTNKTIEDTVNKLREAGGEDPLSPLQMRMLAVDEVTQSLGRRLTYAIEQMKALDEQNLSATEKEKARLTIVAGLGEAYKEVQATAAKAGTEEASKLTSIISLQRLQTGSIKDTIAAMGRQQKALDDYHAAMLKYEQLEADKELKRLYDQRNALQKKLEGIRPESVKVPWTFTMRQMLASPSFEAYSIAERQFRERVSAQDRAAIQEEIADTDALLRVVQARKTFLGSQVGFRTNTTDHARPPKVEPEKENGPWAPTIALRQKPAMPEGGTLLDLAQYERFAGLERASDADRLKVLKEIGTYAAAAFMNQTNYNAQVLQDTQKAPVVQTYLKLKAAMEAAEKRLAKIRTTGVAPLHVSGNMVDIPGLPAPSVYQSPQEQAARRAVNAQYDKFDAFGRSLQDPRNAAQRQTLQAYLGAVERKKKMQSGVADFTGVGVFNKVFTPSQFMGKAKIDAGTFKETLESYIAASDALDALSSTVSTYLSEMGTLDVTQDSVTSARQRYADMLKSLSEWKAKHPQFAKGLDLSPVMSELTLVETGIEVVAAVSNSMAGFRLYQEGEEKWRGLANMRIDMKPVQMLAAIPSLLAALPDTLGQISLADIKKGLTDIRYLDPEQDADSIHSVLQAIRTIQMGLPVITAIRDGLGDKDPRSADLLAAVDQDIRSSAGVLGGMVGTVAAKRTDTIRGYYQSLFEEESGTGDLPTRIARMRAFSEQVSQQLRGEKPTGELASALSDLLREAQRVVDETVAELIKNDAEALTKNIDNIQSDLEQSLALAEQQPFAEGSKTRLAAIRAAIDAEVAIQDAITAAMLNVEGRGTEPYYEELNRLAEMQEQSLGRRNLRAFELNKAITEARIPLEMLLSGQVTDKRYAPKTLLDLQKQQEDLAAAAGRIGMTEYAQEAAELKTRGVELVAAYMDEVMQYLMGTDASSAEVEAALAKANQVVEEKVSGLTAAALENRRKQFLTEQAKTNTALSRQIDYSGRMAQLTGRDDWESFVIAKQIELEQRKYEVQQQYRDANYQQSAEYAKRLQLLEKQTQQEIAAAWRERLLSVRQMYRDALGSLLMDFTDIKGIFDQLARKVIQDSILHLVDTWKPLSGIVNGSARRDMEYSSTLQPAQLPGVSRTATGGAVLSGFAGAGAHRSLTHDVPKSVISEGLKTKTGSMDFVKFKEKVSKSDPMSVNVVDVDTKNALPVNVVGGVGGGGYGGGGGSPKLGGDGTLQQLLAGYGTAAAGFSAGQAGDGMGIFGAALSGAASGMSMGGPLGAAIGGGLGLIGGLFGSIFKKKKKPEQNYDPIQLPTSADIQFAAPVTMPRSAYLGGRAGGGTTNTNYTTVEKIEVTFPNVRNPDDARVAGEAFASALPSNVAELRQSRRRQVTVRM